jgi:hypothetical protein
MHPDVERSKAEDLLCSVSERVGPIGSCSEPVRYSLYVTLTLVSHKFPSRI